MKFINYVKYRDLDKIASARTAHFAYADRLREQGKENGAVDESSPCAHTDASVMGAGQLSAPIQFRDREWPPSKM